MRTTKRIAFEKSFFILHDCYGAYQAESLPMIMRVAVVMAGVWIPKFARFLL